MKRKALLIGNTNGLNGVQLDIERFSGFLKSKAGGSWYLSEIETMENPRKIDVALKLKQLRNESLDYFVLLFSGHAGYIRSTVMELNKNGEIIDESEFHDIADRQLNIYDCCRVIMSPIIKKAFDSIGMEAQLAESIDRTRTIYEERIMQAIPQQAYLYSCAIGESSYDTADGAIYLKELLSATKSFSSNAAFLTVGEAHGVARAQTNKKEPKQTPEARLAKCLTQQQLILAMKV